MDKSGTGWRPTRDTYRAEQARKMARYGLTVAEYDALYDSQGGACAICGVPVARYTLAVDHDHCALTVRGLLCFRCNCGLGLLADEPRLLEQAIVYLREAGA